MARRRVAKEKIEKKLTGMVSAIPGIEFPGIVSGIEFGYTSYPLLSLPNDMAFMCGGETWIIDQRLIDPRFEKIRKLNPRVKFSDRSLVTIDSSGYLSYNKKSIAAIEAAMDFAATVAAKLDGLVKPSITSEEVKLICELGSRAHFAKIIPLIWDNESLKKEIDDFIKEFKELSSETGKFAIWALWDEVKKGLMPLDFIK